MRLEDKQQIKEAVQSVSHIVNAYGNEEVDFFVKQMSRQHRTLQQAFTRICQAWFLHLANLEESHYDLRNEASVELAKKIKVTLENSHLPLI